MNNFFGKILKLIVFYISISSLFLGIPTQMYSNPNSLENFIPQTYATSYVTQTTNKYVYVRKDMSENVPIHASVHVNPRFNKNVFVNPNFQSFNNILPSVTKIHINPNVKTVKLPEQNNSKQIHVNPNILQTNSLPPQNKVKRELEVQSIDKKQGDEKRTVYSSRTKLIRTPTQSKVRPDSKKIRRASIRSKFKIVKACILNRSQTDTRNIKTSPLYKYKLVQYKTSKNKTKENKFKLDNRNKEIHNKPLLKAKMGSLIYNDKTQLNKSLSLVKIGGVLYKKSTNSLQKANTSRRAKSSILNKRINKSKYKIVRLSTKTIKIKSASIETNSRDQKAVRKLKLK